MLLNLAGKMMVGAINDHPLLMQQDGRRGLEHHPPMVIPLWVGHIDPSSTPTGFHIIPCRDLHPLLHDPTTNLMTATQYALGSLQKVGVNTLLPPLQPNPCQIGVAFLRHVLRRFQGTQFTWHRHQAPNLLGDGHATWGTSCGKYETQ